MAGTVTLDKTYFETLLRRAQFHTHGVDFTTPITVTTVAIPKADLDNLLKIAREYANLRRNLFRGGIEQETLAILVKDDAAGKENGGTIETDDPTGSDAFYTQQPESTAPETDGNGRDYTYGRNADYNPRGSYGRRHSGTKGFGNVFTNGVSNSSYDHENNDDFSSPDELFDPSPNDSQSRIPPPKFAKFAKRTVVLSNLAEGTTHADVTNAVRGGMLLDIFLRSNDRSVSVSFLDEDAAQEFFRFVKRHDLYIRGRRVEIRWGERQFILPGHVANKIGIGATRNIIVQNCSPKFTEKMIRDDLEHIHNLVVIDVAFRGQNCYISTNSVHNSMFSRTCMMSRAIYKGSKIEWGPDECAAPLERPVQFRKQREPSQKKENKPMNRFQLLDLDSDEDASSVQEDKLDTGIHLPSGILAKV
ncbi:hypothetical protein LZ554_007123 [Drepanopeziza brunnea f. sp. 'monogermtubi']|nr:hypothetical protein LZ554_007123 [Drepanopeziza brunnea f. sp. 'monogermtubi']